jgi:hypothetical protein
MYFPRDIVCFRNICINTLHKGDNDDDDDDNNNNNNNNNPYYHHHHHHDSSARNQTGSRFTPSTILFKQTFKSRLSSAILLQVALCQTAKLLITR